MKLFYTLTFKRGNRTVATVKAAQPVSADNVTMAETAQDIPDAEQLIEKLTGLRCHISSEMIED